MMRVKVKYMIGKNMVVKIVDIVKMTIPVAARELGITNRQIVSLEFG